MKHAFQGRFERCINALEHERGRMTTNSGCNYTKSELASKLISVNKNVDRITMRRKQTKLHAFQNHNKVKITL